MLVPRSQPRSVLPRLQSKLRRVLLAAAWLTLPLTAEETPESPAPAVLGDLYIREYRVQGSKLLTAVEIGEVVYPFLGPRRTPEDIDQARAALEKAYHDKGYQTVTVQVPNQSGRRGIIKLEVIEAAVGKLRVRDSRYYLPSDIQKRVPSLAPGTVPNFNEVQKDIIALNRSADLRVTPQLNPGAEPGTVDIDLNVKDKLPLHGNLELNNRYSADTVPLRLNGSLSYGNLWQLGHTLGFSFQIAPERLTDAAVYSAFYTVPFPGFENVSLTLSGTKQDSDVSTLGGAAVAGRGDILGLRTNITLPSERGWYHSLSLGIDYKSFDENLTTGTDSISTPIDYYPLSLSYFASWIGKRSFTELNLGANFHARGMGSDQLEFDNKRYNADGSYVYFRGDVAHTHDLPGDFQLLTKIQGQIANHPLINSEQYAGGGQSTVRGYLESEALGDNGVFGTLELRSPSFIGRKPKDDPEKSKDDEWRIYAFVEGGRLTLNDPLPEQQDRFELASIGIGTRIRLNEHFNGSFDASLPLVSQGTTLAHDAFFSFRVWADF